MSGARPSIMGTASLARPSRVWTSCVMSLGVELASCASRKAPRPSMEPATSPESCSTFVETSRSRPSMPSTRSPRPCVCSACFSSWYSKRSIAF